MPKHEILQKRKNCHRISLKGTCQTSKIVNSSILSNMYCASKISIDCVKYFSKVISTCTMIKKLHHLFHRVQSLLTTEFFSSLELAWFIHVKLVLEYYYMWNKNNLEAQFYILWHLWMNLESKRNSHKIVVQPHENVWNKIENEFHVYC